MLSNDFFDSDEPDGRTRVSRKPSPGLVARLNLFKADLEKRSKIIPIHQVIPGKINNSTAISWDSDSSTVNSVNSSEPSTPILNDIAPNTLAASAAAFLTKTTPDIINSNANPDTGKLVISDKFQQQVQNTSTRTQPKKMESVLEKVLPTLPPVDHQQEDHDDFIHEKVQDEMTRLSLTRQPDTPPSSGESTPAAPGELEPELPTTPNNRPRTASSTRPLTASSNFTNDSYFPTTPPDQTLESVESAESVEPVESVESSFVLPTGGGLQRRSSVWSLSRVPFSAQLHRLTSLSLPLSDELTEKIKQLPTAHEACKVISDNAHQIHQWIDHAKNILKGLDAEDDVEWAAQGKESLGEVDGAVQKFSDLVNAYVSVIEDFQTRPDITTVSAAQLTDLLETMEVTMERWAEVKTLLKDIKDQVETAMEWTELWTTILHDIQAELEACQTLVFEMEERRHMSMLEDSTPTMDIDTLETIVEETPSKQQPKTPVSPSIASDEHMLLGLFARMQPLRASLDFLPMRIDAFEYRANNTFPGACDDLKNRKKSLEKKWLKLNSDADVLRRELGEDRWVVIFRNAGKQAGNMIESADRSLKKLREALESGRGSESSVMKKIESYETKKVHYGPAIQRVLGIVEKGIHDRITVNGEILRLHAAIKQRWKSIETEMEDLDALLTELNLDRTQEIRDSISSLNSFDPSMSGYTSPGTSPASSVVASSVSPKANRESPYNRSSSRLDYGRAGSRLDYGRPSSRLSGTAKRLPKPVPKTPTGNSFLSVDSALARGASPTPTSRNSKRNSMATPPSNKPRFNGYVTTKDVDTGHNFKPLCLTTPSPHRKGTPSTPSHLPRPSPLSFSSSPPPRSPTTSSASSSRVSRTAQVASGRRSSMFYRSETPSSPRHMPGFSNITPGITRSSTDFGGSTLTRRPAIRRESSMGRLRSGSPLGSPIGSSPAGGARPATAMGGSRARNTKTPGPGNYAPIKGNRCSMPPGTAEFNNGKPRWR